MGYSSDVYARATATLASRRAKAEGEAAARRIRVIRKQPKALECEQRMAAAASQIAKAFLNGGDIEKTVAFVEKETTAAQQELATLIAAAGEKGTDFSPVYTCPECEDTGYVGPKVCRCLASLLAVYASEELSSTTGMKLSSFDEIDLTLYTDDCRRAMQRVFDDCRDYAAHFDTKSESLLLFGPTGTGKTHAALAIADAAVNRGYSVVYGPATTLFHKMEREHFDHVPGNTEETLLSCDLLVLDDLGTEMSTAFTVSCLYDILNGRMMAGLPTIISTNLSAGDWAARYGDAIASRVLGTYYPLPFKANDVRQAKLERRLASEY